MFYLKSQINTQKIENFKLITYRHQIPFQTNPRIYYMHIKSDIKFRFATTLVTSKVANSAKTPVEAHFQVTLPDAAFITAFAM